MIDFEHLEAYTENNRIEAKTALGGFPESFWETYSAFANTMGGVILLGVSENPDKTFRPVDLPDPEALVDELFRGLAEKKASVNLLSKNDVAIKELNGCRIVCIFVPRADRRQRPVYINRIPFECYKRNGEGDYKMPRDEYFAMKNDSFRETRDLSPATDCTAADFAYEAVRGYRARLETLRPRFAKGLSEDEFLLKIGALTETDDGPYLTAAGMLMFGKSERIRAVFPQYSLSYTVDGETAVSSDEPHFGNLYDFFFRVLALMRRDFPDSGTDSLFDGLSEALVNCLVNADYRCGKPIRISADRDSICFENPGSFRIDPIGLPRGSVADPRNSGLAQMFNLIDASRGRGTGLARLYRIWRKNKLNAPKIKEEFSPDRVLLTLPLTAEIRRASGNPPFEASSLIVDYLTDHRLATADELCAYLRVRPAKLRVLLDDLDASGLITADPGDTELLYRLRR